MTETGNDRNRKFPPNLTNNYIVDARSLALAHPVQPLYIRTSLVPRPSTRGRVTPKKARSTRMPLKNHP
jgi:hypothetical protein